MIRWTVTFLVLGVVAGLFGFVGDIEARAAEMAQYVSFFSIALFIVSVLFVKQRSENRNAK